MYKKPLVSLGAGTLCQLTATDTGALVVSREGGRTVQRQILLPGGKVFGARAVGYGEAYFAFPFATLQIVGEEKVYDAIETDAGAQDQA